MSFASVDGERGVPAVSDSGSMQSRVSSILAVGLMSILGLGMLAWYYSRAISRPIHAQQSAQAESRRRAQGDSPLPSLGRMDPPRVAPVALGHPIAVPTLPESAAGKMATLVPANGVPTVAAALPSKTPAQIAFERQLSGPAYARQPDTSGARSGQTSEAAVADPGSNSLRTGTSNVISAGTSTADTSRSDALAALLTPITTPAAQARVLPTQRFLLSKGAFIDCTLETAIDTTLPGMTTCITATDTFGVDGKVVLLERGTKLVGETQAAVQQGAARVFVLWAEARTPSGVVVPLASPGTDALGRSGLPGEVNRHFWDRFGAAILISVIDVALESALHSGSGGTVVYGPSPAVDIMTEVLKSTVNIAPTVTKSQGDRIQVFVARDLDFRSVYELRAH